MSTVAGVYHLDGRPVETDLIGRMLRIQAHRSPDGEAVWTDGSVGLGHGMLHTTPESLAETLPLSSADGRLVLTAHARIDNRDELIWLLGSCRHEAGLVTDAEIILQAYRAWGEACVERLVGDFAFAIWDDSCRRLFCARDPLGVRPFCYHFRNGDRFAFSSEIKGLLCLPGTPNRLNHLRVADFLAGSLDDQEITFYEGILRLPPAHTLTVGPDGIAMRRYWALDRDHEVRLGSTGEYVEAFRATFGDAVACRARSAYPIGSTLSGGLDSSSIACTLRGTGAGRRGQPLHTFSLIFPGIPEADERPYIEAVVRGGGLEPHLIDADRLSPIEELDRVFFHHDEPCWMFNYSLHWELYRRAGSAGVRVLCDGVGGDTTLSHGVAYLAELFGSGRWIALARSVSRIASNNRVPPLRVLRHSAIRPWIPPRVLTAWRAARGWRGADPTAGARSLLRPGFAERPEIAARLLPPREFDARMRTSSRAEHHSLIVRRMDAAIFEANDRMGAAFGVQPSFPFYDRRLVEFCYGVPAEQKHRHGWGRLLLRRAMEGVLPEEIRWRGDKADLGHHFYRTLQAREQERIRATLYEDSAALEPFVDLRLLRKMYGAYAAGQKTAYGRYFWPALMLGEWLARTGPANPAPIEHDLRGRPLPLMAAR